MVDFNIGTKQLSELRRSVQNEVATCLLLILLRSVYLLSSVRVVFRVLSRVFFLGYLFSFN